MRKRNKLSYETSKLILGADAEIDSADSFFEIRGGAEPIRITVPMSLMHRFFRLGQAYGVRQLRYLQANTKLVVGKSEMHDFHRELKKLSALINDEALTSYIVQLVAAMEAPPGLSEKHIAVSTGDYFGERD